MLKKFSIKEYVMNWWIEEKRQRFEKRQLH
jgi:hypothetical protein